MADKPAQHPDDPSTIDEQRPPAPSVLAAEPRYAAKITMSAAEQEALRERLRRQFH